MGRLVAGLDGFKASWVAVLLDDGAFRDAVCFESLGQACARLCGVVAIAVDIPMGLPAGKAGRAAEEAARIMVGAARASSVFPTYPREVYEAPTREDATRMALALTGKGIGSTAFALKDKILEARAMSDPRVIEVHPEVCFAAMRGQPLAYAKRTWSGQGERRQLVIDHGIFLPCPVDEGGAGDAAPDDLLDAAAAAWTAWRHATGRAVHLPSAPPAGGEGVIWY